MRRLLLAAAVGFAAVARGVGLSGGVETGLSTAYCYNGMVYNDEPCVYIEPFLTLELSDWFWLEGDIWQLYDLTDRRRVEGIQGEWNETQYTVLANARLWHDAERKMAFLGGLGYYWDVCIVDRRWTNTSHYPILYILFENPWLTPYVYFAYDHYRLDSGLLMPGVRRKFALTDSLELEARYQVMLGEREMLSETYLSPSVHTGIASMEGRLTLTWQATDFMKVGAFFALNAIVNKRILDDLDAEEELGLPSYYNHPVLPFGGLSVRLEF